MQPLFRDPCVCSHALEDHDDPGPERLGRCRLCGSACNVYFPANPPDSLSDDASASAP